MKEREKQEVVSYEEISCYYFTCLDLTFSITACGSTKESVKTEQSAESKKVEKSESKKDSKVVAKADSKTEESVEDNAEVQETERGESSEVEEVVTNAKSENSSSGKQKTTSEKNSAQTAGTQSQSATTNTTPSQSTTPTQGKSPSPAPAGSTTPSTTSTPSNTQSDDSLPDDEITPAPEQPKARTLEDELRECGVTNYVLTGYGDGFIDYDGYTIMIDGVEHNIWKGVDYGTRYPYGLWLGGCGAASGEVPAGWNPSWTWEQLKSAVGF